MFNRAYEGTPPWDIGRAQPEFVRLAEEGEIRGSILDVGCGTGENALYLAGLGHEVWGVDSAPRAVEKARDKARERGIEATFVLGDTLDLAPLGRVFDNVIDSGLFHALSDAERLRFVAGLSAALRPGGTYFMLCFSDQQPGTFGPRRVTREEIKQTFGEGWRINYSREARFESNTGRGPIHAWLSSITKVGV